MVSSELKYKDSGEFWMGQIPEHWDLLKLKHLFHEKKIKHNPELGAGSISFGEVVRKADTSIPESTKASYQEVLKDEFLINPLNLNYDLKSLRIALSEIDVVVSSGYIVLKDHQKINKRFYKYLLHRYDVDYMKLLGSGVRQTINFNHISSSILAYPPLEEQTAIANFLDIKTAEIKRFIQLKEKTIELLKERKTAIINEAVTKGLDSNVEMKDSGIEWLGEIPKHWEVKKLKYLIQGKLKYGANESAELDNPDYPRYIRITDFGNDGKLREDTFKSLAPKTAEGYFLEEGDILFARSGGTVGKTFLFKDYTGKACFAGYLIRARVNDLLSSDLLYLFSKSGAYEKWKDSIFNQATIQNIGADKYSVLPIPVPSIYEQSQIIDYCHKRIIEIENLMYQAEKEISLMKEYQESLISEAVTGKIDVREENEAITR